jgi:uncharacterized membrane protein YhaH (DUF805 family)
MDKIKKYFQFSGTINGSNYILRNILSAFVAYLGGFTIGWGIGKGDTSLISLGILIVVPAIVFGFATLYKRVLALFGKDATSYTIGIILVQILQIFSEDPIKPIIGLVIFIFSLILIFKNSNIEKHEG